MSLTFSSAVIADRLQALSRALDQDPLNAGRMLIYGGVQPAPGQPTTDALLAVLSFQKPSADTVAGRVLTLHAPTPNMIAASGVATWARWTDGAGVFVADSDAGIEGSGAVVQFAGASAQLYAGGQLSVASVQLAEV